MVDRSLEQTLTREADGLNGFNRRVDPPVDKQAAISQLDASDM